MGGRGREIKVSADTYRALIRLTVVTEKRESDQGDYCY